MTRIILLVLLAIVIVAILIGNVYEACC